MRFIADFHLHSHYSMATSKESCPEHLVRWAKLKGLQLIGTGDFTHPGWLQELKEKIEPAEEGLYKLKADYADSPLQKVPLACEHPVRFILSTEISSIYKKNGRTRKIHNLLLMPSLAEAEKINAVLDRLGNIRSDGRPILGLDAKNLLEIALGVCQEVIFIPAHIWTPHFSLLGSRSGFDSLEECFEDLSPHIFALETGLSSDPAMNWRLSSLDRYTLVSNSDAHSPQNLAREANCFEADLSYSGIRSALQKPKEGQFLGTIEFFPEEGKYHYDGHRACQVCWSPEQSQTAGGICPQCGKKLTLGVLYRVMELADRSPDVRPPLASPFESIIPLTKILADLYQVGEKSGQVQQAYLHLLNSLGSELAILRTLPLEEIQGNSSALLAEGIRRTRAGEVEIRPGYDGEYGVIKLFQTEDRQKFGSQMSLFGLKEVSKKSPRGRKKGGGETGGEIGRSSLASSPTTAKTKVVSPAPAPVTVPGYHPQSPQLEAPFKTDLESWLAQLNLNSRQQSCVCSDSRPIIVLAGPGTGKTRTLVCRIAYLIKFQNLPPEQILAVTFTNKAAAEVKTRVREMLPSDLTTSGLTIGTFHALCLKILHHELPEQEAKTLIDEQDAKALGWEIIYKQCPSRQKIRPQKLIQGISLLKSKMLGLDLLKGATSSIDEEGLWLRAEELLSTLLDSSKIDMETFRLLFHAYHNQLSRYHLFDYDDLLLETVHLLSSNPVILKKYRHQFTHLLVDEFQDVNEIQYSLVKLLAGDGTNLLVIGDPDQAIYTFRGADHRFFFRLQKEFPHHQLFHLEENYRSKSILIQAAIAVIQQNTNRFPLRLMAKHQEKGLLRFQPVAHEQAEGISIVKEICHLVGGVDMLQAHGQGSGLTGPDIERELGFADFAVLFRTGQQAIRLEECFLKEGLPYRVVGQKSFLQAPPVRLIIAFLRFLVHPELDFPLLSLLKDWEEVTIPISSLESLFQSDSQRGGALFQAIKEGSRSQKLSLGQKERCLRLLSLWESYQPSLTGPVDLLIHDFMAKELKLVQDNEPCQHLCQCSQAFTSVKEFLEAILLGQDGDIEYRGAKTKLQGEAVSLMTIHAAKGLEFPVVFLSGFEEGLIPYYPPGELSVEDVRSSFDLHSTASLEDERRLFYVALTRAKDMIVLVSAQQRKRFHQITKSTASCFLSEIPPHLITTIKKTSRSGPRQLRLW